MRQTDKIYRLLLRLGDYSPPSLGSCPNGSLISFQMVLCIKLFLVEWYSAFCVVVAPGLFLVEWYSVFCVVVVAPGLFLVQWYSVCVVVAPGLFLVQWYSVFECCCSPWSVPGAVVFCI